MTWYKVRWAFRTCNASTTWQYSSVSFWAATATSSSTLTSTASESCVKSRSATSSRTASWSRAQRRQPTLPAAPAYCVPVPPTASLYYAIRPLSNPFIASIRTAATYPISTSMAIYSSRVASRSLAVAFKSIASSCATTWGWCERWIPFRCSLSRAICISCLFVLVLLLSLLKYAE